MTGISNFNLITDLEILTRFLSVLSVFSLPLKCWLGLASLTSQPYITVQIYFSITWFDDNLVRYC